MKLRYFKIISLLKSALLTHAPELNSSSSTNTNNNNNSSFKDEVILVTANWEYADLNLVKIKYFSIQKDHLIVW